MEQMEVGDGSSECKVVNWVMLPPCYLTFRRMHVLVQWMALSDSLILA
jgi:hypothetical protein